MPTLAFEERVHNYLRGCALFKLKRLFCTFLQLSAASFGKRYKDQLHLYACLGTYPIFSRPPQFLFGANFHLKFVSPAVASSFADCF